jgi:tetratricopeptide (TPR) repeat protein
MFRKLCLAVNVILLAAPLWSGSQTVAKEAQKAKPAAPPKAAAPAKEVRIPDPFQADLAEKMRLAAEVMERKMYLLQEDHLGRLGVDRLHDRMAEAEILYQELAQSQAFSQAERQREAVERAREQAERAREEMERARESRERDEERYQRGREYLNEGRWDRALEIFDQVSRSGSSRADGALYWKAWVENKQGQRDAALATLAALRAGHPNSRWLNDAKALEVEVKQRAGQPVRPEDQQDEELKVLALNALMQSNPEEAAPILEKFLQGSASPRLKKRALFVLAQHRSNKSLGVLAEIARGKSNPDLQYDAVQYLALHGGRDAHQTLAEIYAASQDLSIKKRILRSFMNAGARDRLLAAAKSETNPELKIEAIRQLGPAGAREELWQLYQTEANTDVKRELLRSLFVSGNSERLLEAARTEKDPGLRRRVIQHLGTMRSQQVSDALVGLYASEKEPEVRREIINALFVQNNAKALVDLARKETTPEMKTEIVRKLSVMKSKDATDYMMELLK